MTMGLLWMALVRVARSLPWQAWIAIFLFVILLGAGWYLHRAGVAEGGAIVRQEIIDANRNSEAHAQGAGEKVDRCYGSGGTWDRAHGLCVYGTGR